MHILEFKAVTHRFYTVADSEEPTNVIDSVTFSISKGDYVALLGDTGSGKSTMLKLCNALLLPESGEVKVEGISTGNREEIWNIRSKVGMIFQEPDNQLIGTTVVEDVAFGPENLQLSDCLIRERVAVALHDVGMSGYEQLAVSNLDRYHRLCVSLAGIIAMNPSCIVVDDVFPLLPTEKRSAFAELLSSLRSRYGISLLIATREPDIADFADKKFLLRDGKLSPIPENNPYSFPEPLRPDAVHQTGTPGC